MRAGTHALSLASITRTTCYRVDRMCQMVGISERHLRRVFEDGIGITPKDWLRRERMVAARNLLREGHSVKEVSIDLGFASPKIFAREFQAFYEVSPTDFQRKDFSYRLSVA
ncbi:MAG: helix-turn-helix transcriptional regulator [Luteolibacter sp.]